MFNVYLRFLKLIVFTNPTSSQVDQFSLLEESFTTYCKTHKNWTPKIFVVVIYPSIREVYSNRAERMGNCVDPDKMSVSLVYI